MIYEFILYLALWNIHRKSTILFDVDYFLVKYFNFNLNDILGSSFCLGSLEKNWSSATTHFNFEEIRLLNLKCIKLYSGFRNQAYKGHSLNSVNDRKSIMPSQLIWRRYYQTFLRPSHFSLGWISSLSFISTFFSAYRVMKILFIKAFTKTPRMESIPVWVLINIWGFDRAINHKWVHTNN